MKKVMIIVILSIELFSKSTWMLEREREERLNEYNEKAKQERREREYEYNRKIEKIKADSLAIRNEYRQQKLAREEEKVRLKEEEKIKIEEDNTLYNPKEYKGKVTSIKKINSDYGILTIQLENSYNKIYLKATDDQIDNSMYNIEQGYKIYGECGKFQNGYTFNFTKYYYDCYINFE